MAVVISPIGAGFQFFGGNTANSSPNIPLAGGLLYVYAAGTTTPVTTYTSNSGLIPNTNPIVLDSAGRPTFEIWWAPGASYKFVLQDSLGNPIPNGTWDNIPGINDYSIAIPIPATLVSATATTNNPGTTVQAQLNNIGSATGSVYVGYTPPGTGAVATNVAAALGLWQTLEDFGAIGNGVADDTTAITNAQTWANAKPGRTIVASGENKTYTSTVQIVIDKAKWWAPNGAVLKFNGLSGSTDCVVIAGSDRNFRASIDGFSLNCNSVGRDGIHFTGGSATTGASTYYPLVANLMVINAVRDGIHFEPSLAFYWISNCRMDNISIATPGRHGICFIQPNLASTFINLGMYNNIEIRGAGTLQTGYDIYVENQGTVLGEKVCSHLWNNLEADMQGAAFHGVYSVLFNKTGSVSDFDAWTFIMPTFENTLGGGAGTYIGTTGTGVLMRGLTIINSTRGTGYSAPVNLSTITNNGFVYEIDEAQMSFAGVPYMIYGMAIPRTTPTPSAGAVTLTFGSNQIVLAANITSITMPASPLEGQEVIVRFSQNGTGGFTVSGWPGSVLLSGSSFTPTPGAFKTSIIKFRWSSDFTSWYEESRSLNM